MPTSMRPFNVLLLGQAVSLFGSVLTGFALAIWAFKQSDSSVFIYAAIAIANSLPIFLLGPIAGAAADRWNRKAIIITSQIAAISITLALTLLYQFELLQVWHVIALVALNSIFTAFVLPTVTATVPLMVPKGLLTRANGLIALAFGVIELLSPAISGFLYENFGLKNIFLIDLATFLFGLAAIIITHIPQPPKVDAAGHNIKQQNFWQTLILGWQYIRHEMRFFWLMVFFSMLASAIRVIGLMVQPMLLGFTDVQTMGMVMSIAGSGMLFGSLLLIPFKDLQKNMPVIYISSLIIAIGCILTPMTKNLYWLAAGGFILMACFPILDSNYRVLFQRKVDPAMLGRIIGFRNFVMGIFQTFAVISSAWAADKFLEPFMKEASTKNASLVAIYETGQGRGIAVLISLIGVSLLLIIIGFLCYKPVRNVDTELADNEIPEEDPDEPHSSLEIL